LPRTGSTLLTSILAQNPAIHTGPNSPVCQLAWDLTVSCEQQAAEQMQASGRSTRDVVRGFVHGFYGAQHRQVVVDKCRSWTLEPNLRLLEAITDEPRVIVMVRPLAEVVRSLVAARRAAGWQGDLEAQIMRPGSEPVMRSLAGVEWVRMTRNPWCHFVTYDDLVARPEQTLAGIYKFCGWQPFAHTFTNIHNPHPEPDDVYGIDGFHEVRPTLSRRVVSAQLNSDTLAECARLDARL
jgi:sulfotransferase